MPVQNHNVAIAVAGKVIEKWTNYTINCDMLRPADSFNMQIRNPTREVWELVAPDAAVTVVVDGSRILTGFIDDRHLSLNDDGRTLYISGRDKGGRLVDDAAPLKSYKGLDVKQLVERLVKPWFPRVEFSNDINRDVMLGLNSRLGKALSNHSGSKGHRYRRRKPSTKPKYPNLNFDGETRVSRKKVMAGEKRWQVIRSFLEELGLIGWSSADGESFIVGAPDYDQVPVFTFISAEAGTPPGQTPWAVKSSSLRDSVAERYSVVFAVGMGAGDFNVNVAGMALNNPADKIFGVGKDFQHRKVLLVVDDKLKTKDSADVRARREMYERDANGRVVEIQVAGHAQDGLLFAPDTMCVYQDMFSGLALEMLITDVSFTHSDSAGEETSIHLIPKGTLLRV